MPKSEPRFLLHAQGVAETRDRIKIERSGGWRGAVFPSDGPLPFVLFARCRNRRGRDVVRRVLHAWAFTLDDGRIRVRVFGPRGGTVFQATMGEKEK